MSSAPSRSAAPRPVSSTEARLAIAVELHGLDDGHQTAEAAARWLVEAAGAKQVLCLVRSAEEPQHLLVHASHGLSQEALGLLSPDVSATEHPLAPVCQRGEEALVDLERVRPRVDAAGTAPASKLLAVPLGDADQAVGALLVAPRSTALEREARWLASILGPRLASFAAIRAARLVTILEQRIATEEIEKNLERVRLAEAGARAERDRLDLIFDSVDDPIVATDEAGNILHLNPPAERLLQPGPTATLEEQRLALANEARVLSYSSNLLFGKEPTRWRGEITLVDPRTRRTIAFAATAGKVVSGAGELTAIVTVLHDRTEDVEKARLYETIERATRTLEQKVADATAELVRQNEVLRRQHMALEEASRLKSLFLANMSHEFRTPLNAILGYTSMMLEGVGGDLGRTQTRNVERIESNAKHLAAIINDILDISKIEAGKMPLHPAWFELGELIGEVRAELEPLIVRSSLTFTVRVPEGLPTVFSDRAKMKQILVNLLSNAIKFTPQGAIRISARHSTATDRVAIAIQDSGIGIAPEHREAVFEDFRQVDSSTTREYEGTGLGLSICRRLADALGGRIRLSSEVMKGSTFTLVVPRRARKR